MSAEVALDEMFAEFHANNPEVYDELVALARQWRERGYRRVGIKTLWEVLRWNRALAGVGDDRWKLNNSYTSRYARLVMANEPDLAGIFETRELKTA